MEIHCKIFEVSHVTYRSHVVQDTSPYVLLMKAVVSFAGWKT